MPETRQLKEAASHTATPPGRATMDALVPLYPKVAPGGFVIVDDYNLEMCRKAIHDYRDKHGIHDTIVPIDDAGVYWRKSG